MGPVPAISYLISCGGAQRPHRCQLKDFDLLWEGFSTPSEAKRASDVDLDFLVHFHSNRAYKALPQENMQTLFS